MCACQYDLTVCVWFARTLMMSLSPSAGSGKLGHARFSWPLSLLRNMLKGIVPFLISMAFSLEGLLPCWGQG